MSIVLTTAIEIDAAPEQVWEVLIDFDSYGQWSNFSRVEGTPEVGTKLSIRMPGMAFKPTVTAATPNRKLEWSANIITKLLFLGQHTFTLARNSDGTTHLDNTETFSGLTVAPFQSLFASSNHNDTGYAVFNRALKARVERKGTASGASVADSEALRSAAQADRW